MRILITGGTGFFGKSLLRHHLFLAELDPKQIALFSPNLEQFLAAYPEFNSHSTITLLRGDIQQRDSLHWDQTSTHLLSTVCPKLIRLQHYDPDRGRHPKHP